MLYSHPQIDLQRSIFLGKPVTMDEFLEATAQIKVMVGLRKITFII
ncbi:hypothetical protein [Pedobacter sp. Bi126]|nr:hypothetical protein [Pedobacter sp. Bi126]